VALYAILRAMGIKANDEIILPGFTCVVVPNAITYLGATPVYVDINPATFNIDANSIEEKITDRTKVIIAQHTFGIPAEMDRIGEIARKYDLYIIEDSCHAIGSKYRQQEVGTFGDAAFFSSQWSKPLTTGLGGWAQINNEHLRKNMEELYPGCIEPSMREELMLRMQYLTYSILFKPSLFWFIQETYRLLSRAGLVIGSSSNEELECSMPAGFDKKMAGWQRKLLEKKLSGIAEVNAHRRWVASLYGQKFKEIGIKTIELSDDYDPVFLRYPILVRNKEKALAEARKKKIEIGDWFLSPVHPNLMGWEKVGYQEGMCPHAENACKSIINLPTHERINVKEVDEATNLTANACR
jgi:dTDP-4-amino-4,6-dideoxygalactose transaminase